MQPMPYFQGNITIRPNLELFNWKTALFFDSKNNTAKLSKSLHYESAKHALLDILLKNKFSNNDLVTIITSSQNQYVSSCVTSTIEKICHWNRELTDRTKAIIVINEFGYIVDLENLRNKFNGLIIEDNAYCFPLITDKTRQAYKNYSIYSFPKFFGGESGGLCIDEAKISTSQRKQLKEILKGPISQNNILRERCYSSYRDLLKRSSFKEYEVMIKNICRSVFFLDLSGIPMCFIVSLKESLQAEGIECTIFYPLPVFILPCNPTVKTPEISKIFSLIRVHLDSLCV
jgi:hypothetical protein